MFFSLLTAFKTAELKNLKLRSKLGEHFSNVRNVRFRNRHCPVPEQQPGKYSRQNGIFFTKKVETSA